MAFPFLTAAQLCITMLAARKHPQVKRKRIMKRFMYTFIANNVATGILLLHVLFTKVYITLESQKHTFGALEAFGWRLYQLLGMGLLRTCSVHLMTTIYGFIDPSQNHNAYSFTFLTHCLFLSYLRASASKTNDIVGVFFLTLSDFGGLALIVIQIMYNVDFTYYIKYILCLTKEGDHDVGIDIVEYSLYVGLEEISEIVAITTYILTEITIAYLPSKNLIAGTGLTAFGLHKTEGLQHIQLLLGSLLCELGTYIFLHFALKWKCDIYLTTAMAAIFNDNGYLIYFSLFSVMIQNMFRFVPLGCDLFFNFAWLSETVELT